MQIVIILAAAILPALLLWLYIWFRDPQPEPLRLLLKSIVLGIIICLPVSLVEGFMSGMLGPLVDGSTPLGSTLEAFLVAAVPEETFKLLALWLVLRRNPYFDEHFDGIVYAVSVGLGFAATENVLYLFSFIEDWQSVALSRALLAVPGHYAFAVLMGYYYSVYHFTDHFAGTAICILLVPVLAHGIYDALALSGQVSPVLSGLAFLVLIYFCVRMHKFAHRKVLAQLERDRSGEFEIRG